jgi:hypothetical protein
MSIHNTPAILTELAQTIGAIGVDKTTNALISARQEDVKFADKNIEFVVKVTVQRFKVPFFEIIHTKSKDANRIFALQFICYYLRSDFNLSYDDIGEIVDRNKSLVHRYYTALKKIKIEKVNHGLQRHFQAYDYEIKQFKLSNQKQR